MKKLALSLTTLVFLAVVNISFWALLNQPKSNQSWSGTMMGVAFNPMREHHDPEKKIYPSTEEIDADLALLSDKVHAVRTYTVSEGLDRVPQLAAKHGLNVTLGAWISDDLKANQQEIDKLIALSRQDHPNIIRTLVGNEVLLRKEATVAELIAYIKQVKKHTWRPVSTSETWDIWLKHPELAKEVDFIAAHILPFWEGIPTAQAIDYVFDRYNKLVKAFPDKQVIITEVGWPSNGKPFKHATATLTDQAIFLRDFLNLAEQKALTYYVVEAFDQPWKMAIEGSTGAYWGVFNAQRQAKFPMQGVIHDFPDWINWSVASVLVAIGIMLVFFLARQRIVLPGKLFYGFMVNLVAITVVWTAAIGIQQYQTLFSSLFWILLMSMQAMALLILLSESLEIVEVLWSNKSKRQFQAKNVAADYAFPKVSLHIPIHNEPPEMVRQTLEALTRLDYPKLEVLVLDNNTTDPEVWQPVRDDCLRLGSQFRFFHLENWPGYKAGALNYGLQQTADDAEVIAVIDSDYVVSPDWLKCMVPHFAKSDVGFVQSPQNYHDWRENPFKTFCQWEYAGFFHIGMVQRNEHNAIIQHGTMTMVRKTALNEVGGWGEWCICEDSELGLRLYQAGYDSVYVKDTFGRGLIPDTFTGYKNQRHRWVYGAMQILKQHWRSLLTGKQSELTVAQRFYFISGWLPWISDALAVLFTVASVCFTVAAIVNPEQSELPVSVFVMPTIGIFAFKIFRSFLLYRARVKCTLLEILGAALAGLSLSHTVGIATIQGIATSGRPFIRTPKCEKNRPVLAGLLAIRQELVMLILLLTVAGCFSSIEHFDNLPGQLWMAVLLVQAVPYAASLLVLIVNLMPDLTPGLLASRKRTKEEELFLYGKTSR